MGGIALVIFCTVGFFAVSRGWPLSLIVIPADAYMDVGSRATQDAKAEAGIQI